MGVFQKNLQKEILSLKEFYLNVDKNTQEKLFENIKELVQVSSE
jgi:hypothetical protein